jgi:hypothetical protein
MEKLEMDLKSRRKKPGFGGGESERGWRNGDKDSGDAATRFSVMLPVVRGGVGPVQN